MGSARSAERAFFPLDDELALLPGTLTPSLQEDLVHLGTWMPFGRAVQELQRFRRVEVSRPTAERLTEAAGAAYVAHQTAEAEQIVRVLPVPPARPAKQLLSVDGAMVPLVGGEWAEVKTLVLGQVEPPVMEQGAPVVHTTQHSYFSRLTDAETFQRLAMVETQRRGVETAQAVAAVTDGSEWCQKFIDHHRYDALRILDFPHAGDHLSAAGQLVFGEGSAQAQSWLTEQMHCLKHEGPQPVLAAVQNLVREHPDAAALTTHLAYLEKRAAHMQYPTFQQLGWPIGDGAVESGNKLVVEARLKGSGMHWARTHVDAMLALRNIACSDRWEEAWAQITQVQRRQAHQRRVTRQQQSRQRRPPAAALSIEVVPLCAPTPAPAAPMRPVAAKPPAVSDPAPAQTNPTEPWRPPANHPWRHMPIGRARFRSPIRDDGAKT